MAPSALVDAGIGCRRSASFLPGNDAKPIDHGGHVQLSRLFVEASIQALMLVVAATVAVWFDRRAKLRRDVEEAVLRLDLEWLRFFLLVFHESDDEERVSEAVEPVRRILSEIRMKARGYLRPSRRNRILATVEELGGHVSAADARLHLMRRPAPSWLAVRAEELRKDLMDLVFGDGARPPRYDLTPLMREMDDSEPDETHESA
jgi:hypothetical protein